AVAALENEPPALLGFRELPLQRLDLPRGDERGQRAQLLERRLEPARIGVMDRLRGLLVPVGFGAPELGFRHDRHAPIRPEPAAGAGVRGPAGRANRAWRAVGRPPGRPSGSICAWWSPPPAETCPPPDRADRPTRRSTPAGRSAGRCAASGSPTRSS